MPTKNLKVVKLNFVSNTAPQQNLQILWYDTNVGENVHKYWDTALQEWLPVKTIGGAQLAQLLLTLGLGGGDVGEVLMKLSDLDGQYTWSNLQQLVGLDGGLTGEVLLKVSSGDGDIFWGPYPSLAPPVAYIHSFTQASQGDIEVLDVSILSHVLEDDRCIPQIIESDLGNTFIREANIGDDYEVTFTRSGSVITHINVEKLKANGSRNVALNFIYRGIIS